MRSEIRFGKGQIESITHQNISLYPCCDFETFSKDHDDGYTTFWEDFKNWIGNKAFLLGRTVAAFSASSSAPSFPSSSVWNLRYMRTLTSLASGMFLPGLDPETHVCHIPHRRREGANVSCVGGFTVRVSHVFWGFSLHDARRGKGKASWRVYCGLMGPSSIPTSPPHQAGLCISPRNNG